VCRGCFFVRVDIPSGGDIDGCNKHDILEGLVGDAINEAYPCEYMNDIWEMMEEVLADYIPDEEFCFSAIPDYWYLTFTEANRQYWRDQKAVMDLYEERMRPIVERRVWEKLKERGYNIQRTKDGGVLKG